MNTNKEVEQYHFEFCPKCGKLHPHLVKVSFSNSGKQVLQCKDCGKRFVVDHGQLTYYSHQSPDKWNDLITDTLQGNSLLKPATEINAHEMMAFRMRHKFLKFLEDEQSPLCTQQTN